MSYAPNPVQALVQRSRYLCSKQGVGLKDNEWNPCWRVWVELVQKMHLIWPPERVVFSLALGMDERLGVGPATIVQGAAQIHYCDHTGQDTGSDIFVFEWLCPLLLNVDFQAHQEHWDTTLGQDAAQHTAWLKGLLAQPTLRKLSAQGPVWRRSIAQLREDEPQSTDENTAFS